MCKGDKIELNLKLVWSTSKSLWKWLKPLVLKIERISMKTGPEVPYKIYKYKNNEKN